MKHIQAELWNRLTSSETLHESGLENQCQTPRATEAETLYEAMSEKFYDTLSDSQRDAFYALHSMAETVRWDQHEQGIAIGLHIARELQKFLSSPSSALRRASGDYTPLLLAEKSNIQALDSYFEQQCESPLTSSPSKVPT